MEFRIGRFSWPRPAKELPGLLITYVTLRQLLSQHEGGHGEGQGVTIAPGVSIHDHPDCDRPLQIHFMVDGQKVAEIGPPQWMDSPESVVPGYIDFLAEWEGRPVSHLRWKLRIEQDNCLNRRTYEDAIAGLRR